MRVLVVEDEAIIAAAVGEALEAASYAVDLAAEVDRADELASVNDYDLIVLDWGLPGGSGLELLRNWRDAEIQTPVLMLTGRSEVADRVDGLDSGADDYLTKPFSIEELLARVRSLIRRRPRELAHKLEVGGIVMDRAAHRVTVLDAPLELSPKEFALLEYFLHHPDSALSRAAIAEHVWDDSFDPLSNVIDVTVHRLRKKLEAGRGEATIETVKGVGYRLTAEAAD